jgi:hypothetical protein
VSHLPRECRFMATGRPPTPTSGTAAVRRQPAVEGRAAYVRFPRLLIRRYAHGRERYALKMTLFITSRGDAISGGCPS